MFFFLIYAYQITKSIERHSCVCFYNLNNLFEGTNTKSTSRVDWCRRGCLVQLRYQIRQGEEW